MRARGGIRTTLAGAVVGALVLFGAPMLAAADELPADPSATEASVTTEPTAEPAAEPAAPDPVSEPAPEPAVEAEAPPAATQESPPPAETGSAATPPDGSESAATFSDEGAPQVAARMAPADAGGPPVTTIPEWNDHVDICHSTASATNPYVAISPSVRSIIDPNGDPNDEYDADHAHSMHHDFGDIIPEFDYFDKDGGQHHFPGLNLDLLPIFENDCNLPQVGVLLSVAPCPSVATEARIIDFDLSNLAISFDYELTVYVAGTTEVVRTLTFQAVSGTLSGSFTPLSPGDYVVVLHRVGADPYGDLSRPVTLTACPVPFWELEKSSDPVDGATVPAGSIVTYTLTATNTSQVLVTGAVALDDVSDVIDNATLWMPLPAGLTGPVDGVLTWAIPDLQPGASATVSYAVAVNPDASGTLLHNVVEPTGDGECPVVEEDEPCVVDHPVGDVNLVLVKDESTEGDEPVDSGEGDVITYTLTITNEGEFAAFHSLVTDQLPDGVTYVDGSAVISPNPGEWGPVDVTDGVMTVQHMGWIEPGDVITITFDVTVGDLAQPGTGPIPDLVNSACVASEPYEAESESGELIGHEADESDNCDEATTPVKSIGLTALAQCQNDTPLFSYSITPYNIDDPSANPIVLIWWTPAAFASHDPSIPASDIAAILADGASQVDPIAYPPGWTSGQAISGQQLWPGAEVDAAGNPIDWPGWTLLADGTWVLDPSAPFYDLRAEAVVEIRINPSNDAVAVYPPPTPNCNAAPPSNTPPTVVPASTSSSALPGTGFETGGFLAAALGLLVAGGVGMAAARSRRRMTE